MKLHFNAAIPNAIVSLLAPVQSVSANPGSFAPDSSDVYGVGAFQFAGCKVYQFARK